MKLYKRNVFAFGTLSLILLISLVPMSCEAASYFEEWSLDLETDSFSGACVDNENNLYYSYWNDVVREPYFTKIDEDGKMLYDKPPTPDPACHFYDTDDFGNYYFIDIQEQYSSYYSLGKGFIIKKYTSDLIYESTSTVNLSVYFEGNFTGQLCYVDSNYVYAAILEYQSDIYDLNCLQLAKFDDAGTKLWNITISTNPSLSFFGSVGHFGFCRTDSGIVYVASEGFLYNLDDEDGEDIWEKQIILDNAQYTIESYYLIAYQENVLMVARTLSSVPLFKLWGQDDASKWEIVLDREEVYRQFYVSSISVEGEYLGIVTIEYTFDSEEEELTNIFNLLLLNVSAGVICTERIEYIEEASNQLIIQRHMQMYPTNDGHFYLFEYFSDTSTEILDITLKYCIPKPKFTSGYTIPISLFSMSILVLAVTLRRRRTK